MKPSFRSLLRCNLLKALLLLLLLLLWLLAGCARSPAVGPLPEGFELQPVAVSDAGTPFAVDRHGERVALVHGGLRVLGEETLLAAESPVALAWSPDGARLAAVFAHGEKSLLKIFAGGKIEREEEVAGRVDRLVWHPDVGLLAVATTLEIFSFGANHRTVLYRWAGEGAPLATPLHDVTLKPRTLHLWGEGLYRMAHLALSPAGDELLFTRLHDPPEFDPYLKIVLRHLDTGEERELAQVSLVSGGALFAPGETVLYGDGFSRTVRLDPWTGQEQEAWDLPGRHLAASPGGRCLLIDGRLYRDGTEVAAFTAGSEGQFAAGRLFLRDGNRLYRLSGLAEEPSVPIPPAVREELRRLRRWRSGGLIGHEDYLQQRTRMLE